jgi:hypothetical protein
MMLPSREDAEREGISWVAWLMLVYALVVCITYGHAWANVKPAEGLIQRGAASEARFWMTISSAIVWPFYWSCVAFEKPTVENA